MGAIEKALRNASNRKGRFIFEPTPGMTFDCVSETQEFYNIYSWEVGFGTKKGDKYGKNNARISMPVPCKIFLLFCDL